MLPDSGVVEVQLPHLLPLAVAAQDRRWCRKNSSAALTALRGSGGYGCMRLGTHGVGRLDAGGLSQVFVVPVVTVVFTALLPGLIFPARHSTHI